MDFAISELLGSMSTVRNEHKSLKSDSANFDTQKIFAQNLTCRIGIASSAVILRRFVTGCRKRIAICFTNFENLLNLA